MLSVKENEIPFATTAEAAETPPAPDTDANAIYSGGAVRILVIDNDPLVGRLITAMLAGNEFRIEVIHDAPQVLPALRDEHYHVIIMDYVLPGLDAAEVVKQLLESQADANLIVMTAFPAADGSLQLPQTYSCDSIAKPFQVDHLKKTVMRRLENRGLLRLSEDALRIKLGLAIRERRKGLGLTLFDVSKRTGISLGYLSQIELGKNSASIETLYRIALGLRVRVSDLFHAVQAAL
jgi:CheY-like chemotaxis protein